MPKRVKSVRLSGNCLIGSPLLLALINPNSNQKTTAQMVEIARKVDARTNIVGLTARSAPRMILDAAALDASAPEVVAMAPALTRFDGVIVSAFGDPGVAGLAAGSAMPVVGIGAAAARAAAHRGLPFAVATTTPGLVARIDDLMQREGGHAPYLGCFVSEVDPLELMADPAALDAALMHQIHRAAGAGARQIIIGGGPLGDAAQRLAADAPVPLIQPIREAILSLATLRPAAPEPSVI